MAKPSQFTDSEPSQEDEAVDFRSKNGREEDELDMTPMVDVTFLLLIFFMVTAAFSLQKSKEAPPPEQQENATQSQTIEELEQDNVIIRIDRDDTIWVDGSEAPSEQELLEKLREACKGKGSSSKGASSLLVLADGECHHETVVRAIDAGNSVGMERVRMATMDDSSF